jgi:hypothetical protein
MDRPEIVTEKHLRYLDHLRESGVTNMWGAGEYVKRMFKTTDEEAGEILGYWMDTFSERRKGE